MRILICGSRKWTDAEHIAKRVSELPHPAVGIQGGAAGADTIAMIAACRRGLHVATVKALWETYRKSAGPRRNSAMLDLEPHLVIAFSVHTFGTPTGGTANVIMQALERGIPVELHNAAGSVQELRRPGDAGGQQILQG